MKRDQKSASIQKNRALNSIILSQIFQVLRGAIQIHCATLHAGSTLGRGSLNFGR